MINFSVNRRLVGVDSLIDGGGVTVRSGVVATARVTHGHDAGHGRTRRASRIFGPMRTPTVSLVFFALVAIGCGAGSSASSDGGAAAAGASPGSGGYGAGGVAGGATGGTPGGGGSGASGGVGPSAGGPGAGGTGAGGTSTGAGGTGGSSSGAGGTGGSGATAGQGSGGSSGGGAAAVRFVGRVDTSDPARARFAWSGSGVVARFTGTSVSARLEGGQQYTVVLDGAVRDKLVPSSGMSLIAADLEPGEHTIELYRRTEANQGESQFLGFDFGGGQLLAPPPRPERRIEAIGDSITCGYGVEGADMNCPFSPDTENHYLTYAAISARELGAELSTVAWSGKGVVCNYGDDASSCVDPFPTYYDRTLPERADSVWDFGAFQPHAVVINLGTNDFSTAQDPSQAEFEAAYVAFLERVRDAYPDAWILCTVAPLLNGTDLSSARSYIANAVAQRSAAGDAKVKAFELSPTNGADGYGCDWHPSQITHEKMAAELTAEIRATLGW